MGKLVILKLGDGGFEQGFPVTLEIGEDKNRPSLELIGKLPPIPEIRETYEGWTKSYRNLGDDQRAVEPAADLDKASLVGVVPESTRIGARKLVSECFAGRDRLLREMRNAVHGVGQPDAMPVDRRFHVQRVLDLDAQALALAVAKLRTRHGAVVVPQIGGGVAGADEGLLPVGCNEPMGPGICRAGVRRND